MDILWAVTLTVVTLTAIYLYFMVLSGRLHIGHGARRGGKDSQGADAQFDAAAILETKKHKGYRRGRLVPNRPAQAINKKSPAPVATVDEDQTAEDMLISLVKAESFLDSQREQHIMLPGEMKRLIEFTPEEWKPLMILACYSGMTAEELCGLVWEDVEAEHNRIHVQRVYAMGKFHDLSGSQKRTIIVPPYVMKALEKHRQRQRLNGVPIKGYFVFTGATNKELNVKTLKTYVFRLAAAGGCVKNCEFDDLRYSYAMVLVTAGENLRFIQRQLGFHVPDHTFDKGDYSLAASETGASYRLAEIFGVQITGKAS